MDQPQPCCVLTALHSGRQLIVGRPRTQGTMPPGHTSAMPDYLLESLHDYLVNRLLDCLLACISGYAASSESFIWQQHGLRSAVTPCWVPHARPPAPGTCPHPSAVPLPVPQKPDEAKFVCLCIADECQLFFLSQHGAAPVPAPCRSPWPRPLFGSAVLHPC